MHNVIAIEIHFPNVPPGSGLPVVIAFVVGPAEDDGSVVTGGSVGSVVGIGWTVVWLDTVGWGSVVSGAPVVIFAKSYLAFSSRS